MTTSTLDIDPKTLGWSSPEMRDQGLAYYEMSFLGAEFVANSDAQDRIDFTMTFEWPTHVVTFRFPSIADMTVAAGEGGEQYDPPLLVSFSEFNEKDGLWGILVGRTTYRVQSDGIPSATLNCRP